LEKLWNDAEHMFHKATKPVSISYHQKQKTFQTFITKLKSTLTDKFKKFITVQKRCQPQQTLKN